MLTERGYLDIQRKWGNCKTYQMNTVSELNQPIMQDSIVPFLRGLPEEHKEQLSIHKDDIVHIQKWMIHQQHLPKISDEYVLLFLHSCEYSLERSKNTIETFFTIRTAVPELFANRDPLTPEMKLAYDTTYMVSLPDDTPEGYRVMLIRLADKDPAKANVTVLMKAFLLFTDRCISDDGLAPGYVVLFDMTGLSLGHLAKFSLPILKRLMVYMQEALPVRLKSIIIFHCNSFLDRMLALVKPLMNNELLNLFRLESGGAETFSDHIPIDIMPEDYGGKAKSTADLQAERRRRLETEYISLCQCEAKFLVDESKRAAGNGKTHGQLFGMEGSFRKLSID